MNPQWSRAEKAGGLLLALTAVALGLIAADIMSGGRLLTRGGCCPDEAEEAAGVSGD